MNDPKSDDTVFLNKGIANPGLVSEMQRLIQNPAKHLRWIILRKQFTV